MKFLDPAFEVPITETTDGTILLNHRFLFWENRAELYPCNDRIVITKKGLFSKTRKEGSIHDAIIRIESEDMGGPSYQLRFGFAATLMIDNERFLLTKQYGMEYVDDYVEQLLKKVGHNLRVERVV